MIASTGTKPLGILMLGGAKRVSIGRKLLKAFADRGVEARLVSYELEAHVPIAAIGTVVIGKRWNSPELQADLDRVKEEYGIGVVIPFVDGAVAVAAQFASRCVDVFYPGSDEAMATAMFDKTAADGIFHDAGLPTPRRAFADGNTLFPLIAKPRRGSASKGIRIIKTAEALSETNPEEFLIQEYICGGEEISIDCYVSVHTGKVLCISPRRRVETLGGEAVRSITLDKPEAKELARRILEKLPLRGAVTIQLICEPRDVGRLMIMEINPRLGGGVVCSIGAGADIPGLIADEALGLEVGPVEASAGVEMVRYFDEVIFRPRP